MDKEIGIKGYTTTAGAEAVVVEGVRRPRFWEKIHTFDSLKERNYRWLWFGMVGSFAAMQMQMVARGWLVVDTLNGSALDLGIVMSSMGIPLLVFSLFGGVVTDRVQKRNLLIVTQVSIGLTTLIIATLVATELIQLWHLILSGAVTGTIFAFNMPSRQSLLSELVSRENLTNAVALNSAGLNMNRVVAPTMAGVLVGVIGIEGVYFLMVGCYTFVVFSLTRISAKKEPPSNTGKSLVKDLKDGLSYVRTNSNVLSLLLLAFAPAVLAMPYQSLMPLFAKNVLGVGSSGLGFLMGAVGVGAVAGTLGLASLSHLRSKGRLLIAALLTFGLALMLFAFSTSMYLSLAALFIVGVGSMSYNALNHTLLLTNTDPEMRGRVTSMYMMTIGLMPLGLLPAGAVADAISPGGAVSIGAGLLMLSTIVVVLWRPQIRKLS